MDERVKLLKEHLSKYRNAATIDAAHTYRDIIENMLLDELDRADALKAEIERLREALESLRQSEHYECEDCWYSCEKHPDCCYVGKGSECTCGMDRRNAIIDDALKGGE